MLLGRNLGFLLISLLLIIPNVQARHWSSIKIPGAKCGNGSDYKVFWNRKSQLKLAIEFMGGGACWNASTCFGPNLRTWIHPIPKIPSYSVFTSEDTQRSPVANHSMLYFPYCTGDVFAGRHTARYGWNIKVNHHGHINIQKALSYLNEKKIINFNKLDDVVLFGASAGGIASLFHAPTVDKYLNRNAKRTIISDSPGLHFGKRFWEKFTKRQLRDFHRVFKPIGFDTDFSTGFMAPYLPKLCHALSKWNIGFLQSSQDVVMTRGFGEIDPLDHENLIYGEHGLFQLTESISNCSAWVPRSRMHTWLLSETVSRGRLDGVDAIGFAFETYRGSIGLNYRSPEDPEIWLED